MPISNLCDRIPHDDRGCNETLVPDSETVFDAGNIL
jgi:hypothetical protein